MANGNFGQMVAEGAALANGLPPQAQGAVIGARILAGSLGGAIYNILGGLGADRNMMAAILQPDNYPITLTASTRSSTIFRVGQFGNFIATSMTGAVVASGAPQAVASYTFRLNLRFGRTDFAWCSNDDGITATELFQLVGSGVSNGSIRYIFPRAIMVERASIVTAKFLETGAATPAVYLSLHGYYDLKVGAQSAAM